MDESFGRAFSKARRIQGQRPWLRSAERETPFIVRKRPKVGEFFAQGKKEGENHKWGFLLLFVMGLCEETVSVLFEQGAAKRTKNSMESFRSLRRATKGSALGARDLFAKRSIKNSSSSSWARLRADV